jgi:hypothetical protein
MISKKYLKFVTKPNSAQMYTMKRCVEVNLEA